MQEENESKTQKNPLDITQKLNTQNHQGEKKEIFDNFLQKQLFNNLLNSNMPLLNGLMKNQNQNKNWKQSEIELKLMT